MSTHQLVVSHVEKLTDDAVAVSFDVPETLRTEFSHQPGQHLLVLRDGLRRTYSICSVAGATQLRIGVKRLPGGAMSSWINDELRAGDAVEVMAPRGQFTSPLDQNHARRYAAVVAGSGITPVLSLASTILGQEPTSRFTLVYGNRTTASIMFLEDLEDLKNRYPDRFELFHVLSREAQVAEVLSGRLDRDRLNFFFDRVVPVADVDTWFLCGPFGLVETTKLLLEERHVLAERIHREVFYVDDADARPLEIPPEEQLPDHAATVIASLAGRTSTVMMDSVRETVLDAVLRSRPDAPYACRGGVCGTCRALVVAGSARMDRSYALEDNERERGYVLTCQAHPVSDTLEIDFDR